MWIIIIVLFVMPMMGAFAQPLAPLPHLSQTETETPSSSFPTVYDGSTVVNTVIATATPINDEMSEKDYLSDAYLNDVRGVDYSPNGLYALASSFDSNLYLYDIQTFEQVRVFSGHTDWVFNADFTQDGTMMASASADDTIRIWDVNSATTLHILDAHDGSVTNVAFSPDDTLLVSTGQDNQVIVWDTSTWTILHRLDGHQDRVWDVSFSPDGAFFVTVSTDETAIVWDTADFSSVATLDEHEGMVISVEYSPDGQFILTGSHDGSAILWDAVTFAPIRAYRASITGAMMDVVFSSDMHYIATAHLAGNVYVWTVDGEPVATHIGHTGASVSAVQFSPDGLTFLSGADDGKMLLNSVWLDG